MAVRQPPVSLVPMRGGVIDVQYTATNVPVDLNKLGFHAMAADYLMRMLVGSQGLDKTGKTHFALTAPDPIAVINLDFGMEGVGNKFVKKGKHIWVVNVPIPMGASPAQHVEAMKRSEGAYRAALDHNDVRSVLVDDASQWWELARLAEFGTLTPRGDVKQMYNSLNQYFRGLIKAGYGTNKNLILTHKVKEVYTTKQTAKGPVDSWDGETYKRSGFGEDGYLVQVNIEHYYQDGVFGIKIINCRQNMDMAGFTLEGSESTFTKLGAMVFDCEESEFV